MQLSNLSDKNLKIGDIFTPSQWADFAIDKFDLLDKWLKGATIFDPTMGDGSLLLSLINKGIKKGYDINDLPLGNLFGIELNTEHFLSFQNKAKLFYGAAMLKNNFLNADIFYSEPNRQFDIIFGNPPWQNFVDLPSEYKERIKNLFDKYDLVANRRDLLLGGSRIDIAALVINKTIAKNLNTDGEAVFFAPLSLLLNDGANSQFRNYRVHGVNFNIESIYDFNDLDAFENVSTRYGIIHLHRDKHQTFPIRYHRWENDRWAPLTAKPIFTNNNPLSVSDDTVETKSELRQIEVEKYATPRQGVNTCGANDIYFFDKFEDINDEICRVSNDLINAKLPKAFVYPLITGANFADADTNSIPNKWILIPYQNDGKPLSNSFIQSHELLRSYLNTHEERLKKRKGILINSWIQRGMWWALLGVGDYNFFPHKIVWEAYGKKTFSPKIFSGKWQANQSLQAYMPMKSLKESERVISQLKSNGTENYLLSQKMEGTMNWAQPGKIKKILLFKNENLSLFQAAT